jgi:hypothetical protein
MPARAVGIIDVELIGTDEDVIRMLTYLESRLTFGELSIFLEEEFKPYLVERIRNRFANEGDDVVGTWAPLSPVTEQWRAWGRERQFWSVGDDHPINQRTREMYDYLTEGTWQVYTGGAGQGSAVLSSPTNRNNDRKMREKLSQAQRGRGSSPSRPVLGMNEADLAYFLTLFALHLAGPPASSSGQTAIGGSTSSAGAIE